MHSPPARVLRLLISAAAEISNVHEQRFQGTNFYFVTPVPG
jgi:hypothetical protein